MRRKCKKMQRITTTVRDYHGLTVDQAIADLENSLALDDTMALELIVGHGKIKDAVLAYLDRNEIEWEFASSWNSGCVRVWLEFI